MSRKTTVKSGIYQIRNLINNKVYIGSSKNLPKRWAKHRWQLRKGTHHSGHLQAAWNKYGESSFKIEVLEEVTDIDLLHITEQRYMDELQSSNPLYGYNIRVKANPTNVPIKPKDFGQKMSKILKGRKFSLEARERMSRAHKGKVLSAEHIAKRSAAIRGQKRSQETKDKMSKAAKGKIVSEETRHRLSVTRKERELAKGEKNYFFDKGGEKSPHAKLTWDQVREIRKSDKSVKILAKEYDVHENTLRSILKGQTWKE